MRGSQKLSHMTQALYEELKLSAHQKIVFILRASQK